MGLFNKDNSTRFRLIHYEGINAFPEDYGVDVTCTDTDITFRLHKQEATANLDISQISDVQILPANEFMQKHKSTTQPQSDKKLTFTYYVIKYVSSDGGGLSNCVARCC